MTSGQCRDKSTFTGRQRAARKSKVSADFYSTWYYRALFQQNFSVLSFRAYKYFSKTNIAEYLPRIYSYMSASVAFFLLGNQRALSVNENTRNSISLWYPRIPGTIIVRCIFEFFCETIRKIFDIYIYFFLFFHRAYPFYIALWAIFLL